MYFQKFLFVAACVVIYIHFSLAFAAFSALAVVCQGFTRKHCLGIVGLRMRSVT